MSLFWNKILYFYSISLVYTWSISFLIILEILPKQFHYIVCFGPLLGGVIMISLDGDFYKKINSLFVIKKPLWFWLGGTSPIWGSAIILIVLKIMNYPIPSLSNLGEINFLGNIGFWVTPLWIFTFGLGEEIGWRGFLLPKLLERYSILKATLILWIFWTFWHLPFFFYLPNYMDMGVGGMIGFVFSLLSGTIFLSWLFERSGKNISTTILWHGLFNVVTASAFGNGNIAMILSMIIIFVSIMVIIVWLLPYIKRRTLKVL